MWRSHPDGSERLQLTYPPMQVRYAFISPDGKQVVYGNIKGEIYVISMDGGPPERVVEEANAANWSADGNVLVFQYGHPAHPELQFLDLRTGKRSVVPGSQDLTGGQWVSENTLVAVPMNAAKLEIFDVRTQKRCLPRNERGCPANGTVRCRGHHGSGWALTLSEALNRPKSAHSSLWLYGTLQMRIVMFFANSDRTHLDHNSAISWGTLRSVLPWIQ